MIQQLVVHILGFILVYALVVTVFVSVGKLLSFAGFLTFASIGVVFGVIYGIVAESPLTIPADVPLPLFKWENQFWNPTTASDGLWILGLSLIKIIVPGFGVLFNALEKDEDMEASGTMVLWVLLLVFAVASSAAFITRFMSNVVFP